MRAGDRYTAACATLRWQPPPAAGSLTERRWQLPAGRAGLCAVAAAGREGRIVRRSQAPPVGGRLTERADSRRPGGPACVQWQPSAARAGLCANLIRRLLAGALQRELATADRGGQLVCRGNRRPGRPACVPISCTACWQEPYREWVASAGLEGQLVCRSHAPPVGRRLTERRWQRRPGGPACVPISCAVCGRAPYREKTSRAACWRAPRPGRVARACLRDLRCHEGLDRDSCSKQLDSDRLCWLRR